MIRCLALQVFHEIGVDLVSAGPDPMTAPEAFGLKLLWPTYMEDDEKYLAVLIAGILVTRYERNTDHLPKYSMHLTEVGMHLKVSLFNLRLALVAYRYPY